MKRLLVVALAALQGACGLLLLPLPGEPWILAEDEQTGTATERTGTATATEPEREPTPAGPPSVEPAPTEPHEPVRPAPRAWTGGRVVTADYVADLAVTDRRVYWTDGKGVQGIGLEGGGALEVGRFPDEADTYRLAAGDGFVYAARQNARQILRAEERGGGFVVACQTEGTPGLIAAGGGAVWWTEDESSLWRMEPGQAPERVWTGDDGPVRLAVVGSRAYWLGRGLTSVWSWEAGQATSHALPEGYGHALAADAQGFYVLVRAGGGVEVWSGPGLVRLAGADGPAPEQMAVGPTRAYWAGSDGLWQADKQARQSGRVSSDPALGPVRAGTRAFYWIGYTSASFFVEGRPY